MTPKISLKPDERFFFVGKTGSGKSHLAKACLRVMEKKRWRIVIIEPDGLWMGKTGKPPKDGPGTVDAPRLVSKFNPKLAVQWYVPSAPAYKDENLNQLFVDVFNEGDTIVYVDELYSIVNHNSFSDEFNAIWTKGRKHNVAGWGAAQRPSRIPEFVMSQSENWAVFRLPTPDDVKRVAEYTASPRIREIQLPARYWWYYRPEMEQAQLMSPIPKDGWPGFEGKPIPQDTHGR